MVRLTGKAVETAAEEIGEIEEIAVIATVVVVAAAADAAKECSDRTQRAKSESLRVGRLAVLNGKSGQHLDGAQAEQSHQVRLEGLACHRC